MGKKIQMHILCRRSNGRIGPYTSSGHASKRRPLWEPISECELTEISETYHYQW
jgi:hypothetical protein